MSGQIDFQNDAAECLLMAGRAENKEERALLVDLARAWVLLGEQLKHAHQEGKPDVPKPSPLN